MAPPFRLLLLVFVLAYSSVFGPPAFGGQSRATTHLKLPRPKLHRQRIRRAARAPLGVRVVDYARRMVGVPYVWGGDSPAGFDCSGFVRFVYAHFGVSLAHSSYAQFDRGRVVSRAGLRPGDLVFFDELGHVGIYIGHDRFIHAPHTGTRVRIQTLAGWYSSRFVGARRLRNT
jgi:cell wall-associated NlpC family hydrolase